MDGCQRRSASCGPGQTAPLKWMRPQPVPWLRVSIATRPRVFLSCLAPEGPMPEVDAYCDQHAQRFEQELFELLRIPSVSAMSAHKQDVRAAAEWVLGQFKALGFESDVVETAGHPIVLAESPKVPGAPPCWFTAITMYSRQIRWGSGFRPRLSRPCATAICTPAARLTTRGRCLRTSKAPRPGSNGRPVALESQVFDRRGRRGR